MQKNAELTLPPDRIRVAVVLAKYPVHRLSRQGTTAIEVREAGEGGEWTVRWRVSHNSDFGQPGPLAYKLDTLIINRKLDEVGRPVLRIVRLGGLKEITRDLGLSTHNTRIVKEALYQNAFAGITAKVKYRTIDGTERWIEIAGTRYVVVFAGGRLPDGREADAVYLVLNDFYREILDSALTRPLNYEFLKTLPPAPQRLYELLSYHMFVALKRGGRARMRYSEFCTYSPQTRYGSLWEARRQMDRLHAPHREARYIAAVEFESTTDREGRPDWTMVYTPGKKAKEEFTAFTSKGRSATIQGELILDVGDEVMVEPQAEQGPERTALRDDLVERGVRRDVAVELVQEFEEERIRRQVAQFDWLRQNKPKRIKDPGACLVDRIRNDYDALPEMIESQKRAEQTAERERQEGEQQRS